MQKITLRVISGADRGRVFSDLKPPITIGREEGNVVQINDERVSRYHAKIQDDHGRLVITDLDSTNGTRVNGHPCSLKILHYGDTISIGRTVLLVGSRDQIGDWFAPGAGEHADSDAARMDDSLDFELSTDLLAQQSSSSGRRPLEPPRGLTPGQAAELREILDYVHRGLSKIIDRARVDEEAQHVSISRRAWQDLLVTQSEIAELIRKVEDPRSACDSNDFATGSG